MHFCRLPLICALLALGTLVASGCSSSKNQVTYNKAWQIETNRQTVMSSRVVALQGNEFEAPDSPARTAELPVTGVTTGALHPAGIGGIVVQPVAARPLVATQPSYAASAASSAYASPAPAYQTGTVPAGVAAPASYRAAPVAALPAAAPGMASQAPTTNASAAASYPVFTAPRVQRPASSIDFIPVPPSSPYALANMPESEQRVAPAVKKTQPRQKAPARLRSERAAVAPQPTKAQPVAEAQVTAPRTQTGVVVHPVTTTRPAKISPIVTPMPLAQPTPAPVQPAPAQSLRSYEQTAATSVATPSAVTQQPVAAAPVAAAPVAATPVAATPTIETYQQTPVTAPVGVPAVVQAAPQAVAVPIVHPAQTTPQVDASQPAQPTLTAPAQAEKKPTQTAITASQVEQKRPVTEPLPGKNVEMPAPDMLKHKENTPVTFNPGFS